MFTRKILKTTLASTMGLYRVLVSGQVRLSEPDMPCIPLTQTRSVHRHRIPASTTPPSLAAKDFLNFLKSDEAQVSYERAGFIPATPAELNTTTALT